MQYDLSNLLHKEQFKMRCNYLFSKGCIVELTEKKPKRATQQNKYLHTLLGFFACETGNTLEYVKQNYYKKLVNPAIFTRKINDKFLGEVEVLRSSTDLDTAEMTTSIERFRNWASAECGVYLPSPDEERLLQLMEIEIDRNKTFI